MLRNRHTLGSLLEAYRKGAGVPYAAYGRDLREGQGQINRVAFQQQLDDWLSSIPDTHRRLEREEVEWMMCGGSVLHCLPVGMAEQLSAATGTVMRLGTLRQYAREAGFSDVEVLPIDHFFFRFYRLF